VCVEEGWPQCGIASEIAAIIMESEAFDHLDAPMERITGGTLMTTMTDLTETRRLNLIKYFSSSGADVPMPYATPLEKLALPQLEDIVTVVKRVVNRKL
jgi:pyruvate dehydrogenase E1 component beta subunit